MSTRNHLVSWTRKMVYFKQLVMESQIHGPKRLLDKRHRFLWALSLFIFLVCTSSIIFKTIQRYEETPTYISIVEKEFTLMRFPAVVICPEVEYTPEKIQQFLKNLELPPDVVLNDTHKIFTQLAAYYAPDVPYTANELKTVEYIISYNKMTIDEAALLLTPTCEESLIRCNLFGTGMNCSELFEMMLTKSGFCCVFNGRSINREIREKVRTEPRHFLQTTVYSPFSSLFVVVNTDYKQSDVDLNYKWAYVTNGENYVESGVNGTPIAPGTETWFEYRLVHFVTGEDVVSLDVNLRRCRFSFERLRFFPVYSRRYCLAECESERTLRRCGCVSASHPRPPHISNCNARSLLCERNSAVTYDSPFCNCPQTCDSVSDDTNMVSFPLFPADHFCIDDMYSNLNLSRVAVIRVNMMPNQHRYSQRRALFTPINLFSEIGGVFSVFFGFSILSVLELIQLARYGYQEYRSSKKLNRPAKLVLPRTQPATKKRKKKVRSEKVRPVVKKNK